MSPVGNLVHCDLPLPLYTVPHTNDVNGNLPPRPVPVSSAIDRKSSAPAQSVSLPACDKVCGPGKSLCNRAAPNRHWRSVRGHTVDRASPVSCFSVRCRVQSIIGGHDVVATDDSDFDLAQRPSFLTTSAPAAPHASGFTPPHLQMIRLRVDTRGSHADTDTKSRLSGPRIARLLLLLSTSNFARYSSAGPSIGPALTSGPASSESPPKPCPWRSLRLHSFP